MKVNYPFKSMSFLAPKKILQTFKVYGKYIELFRVLKIPTEEGKS